MLKKPPTLALHVDNEATYDDPEPERFESEHDAEPGEYANDNEFVLFQNSAHFYGLVKVPGDGTLLHIHLLKGPDSRVF